MPESQPRYRVMRWVFVIAFGIIAAIAVMGIMAPQLLERAVAETYLTISLQRSTPIQFATASKAGAYYQIGDQLNAYLTGQESFDLDVVETQGSLENIELLRSGGADFALIQGGLRENLDGLVSVANLQQQYVHLVVPAESAIRQCSDLAGKRLSIGPELSGFHALAEALFDFYGLDPAPEFVNHPMAELPQYFAEGRIDAAFTVYSLFAPQVENLLQDGRYRLVPVPLGDAISQYLPGVRPNHIPARAYGPQRSLPLTDLPTVSVSMLLVTHPHAHDAHVRGLLQAIYNMTFIRRARLGDLTEDKGRQIRDLPMHPAAMAYYRRHEPITADRFEIASFFLAGLVCLASVVHYGLTRFRSVQLERRRKRIIPYFETMLEFGTRVEKSHDVAELTTILHDMMAAQRNAERDWLDGALETEHMENLYAIYNIHSRNAFNKMFMALRARQTAERAVPPAGSVDTVPEP